MFKQKVKALIPNKLLRLILPVYALFCGGNIIKSCLKEKIALKKDQFKNKRCFIIGGAPSILKHDLAKLNDECTFVVNKGFTLHERGLDNATFYGMSDLAAYENYGDKIDPNYAKHHIILGNIPWKLTVKSLSVFSTYSGNEIFKHMHKGFFQKDITKPLSHCYTVVLYMLQIAVWLGFKEIYIIGVDNDFSGNNIHWYDDTQQEKDNIKKWTINNEEKNTIAFAKAYKMLAKEGVNIYNAGIGGSLNSIPRVNYESLFDEK